MSLVAWDGVHDCRLCLLCSPALLSSAIKCMTFLEHWFTKISDQANHMAQSSHLVISANVCLLILPFPKAVVLKERNGTEGVIKI